jgi:hypothetical protein
MGVPVSVDFDDGCYFCAPNDPALCIPDGLITANDTAEVYQSGVYTACKQDAASCMVAGSNYTGNYTEANPW